MHSMIHRNPEIWNLKLNSQFEAIGHDERKEQLVNKPRKYTYSAWDWSKKESETSLALCNHNVWVELYVVMVCKMGIWRGSYGGGVPSRLLVALSRFCRVFDEQDPEYKKKQKVFNYVGKQGLDRIGSR